MHKKFEHEAIEQKWQAKWQADGLYDVGERDTAKEKEYVLIEWPYPSGNLHTGHWYAFAVPDIYVRYQRMHGKQVLYPMGFDAFGLPAENAAIKRNINPREWTESNIEFMKQQITRMGNAFSWDKTTSSTDPEYYKWTQWMFTKFFTEGIAYRGSGVVNWCPGCHTVIANEQVLPDNTCERCGSSIDKREMPQWMMQITQYANRLVDDLDDLDWPEHIKEAQRRWIGRSEGAEIDFAIKGRSRNFVILHGFTGTPDEVFIPWLKAELEKQGHTVQTPTLPDTDKPNEVDQVRYVLKNCTFDENTTVIGHSLGSAVALKVVEQLPHKIHKLVLVAGFLSPKFKDRERNFTNTFNWSFNFELIKQKTEEIVALSAFNDTAVGREHGEQIRDKLDAKLVEFEANDDHVCGENEPVVLKHAIDTVTVFTTRPDTLYGVTYMVLAPEHSLIQEHKDQINNWAEVEAYITATAKKDEQDRLNDTKDKTGVKLEGITATNPANGEEVPVFIADYVLASYGTGAIMAVPAHDERDFTFAEKFNLETRQVVQCRGTDKPVYTKEKTIAADGEVQVTEREYAYPGDESLPYLSDGVLIDSGEFDGMDSEAAKAVITEKVGGRMTNTYRLRDWSVGRQRYWGVPIPIVYDPDENAHPVPAEHLPWTLPEDVDFTPTGEPPLAKSQELHERTERIFGAGWTPEVETMDTFVDSSWYFLRYIDNHNDESFSSLAAQDEWMNVDIYFGGAEHTTMHLLYSRFWQKVLYDLGLARHTEPYRRRINRSLILGPDGNKMSKSKGNVVDPDEQVKTVGADTLKMYLAFMGPYGETSNYPWDMGGIAGQRRFLERVYGLAEHIVEDEPEATTKQLHKTILKVSEDITAFKFNTAISAMMIFVNEAEKMGLSRETYTTFLQLLAPFAPHLSEELWHDLGNESSIHLQPWPDADPDLAADNEVTIGVQINGKHRGEITVAPDATEATALEAVHANEELAAKSPTSIQKVIYKPGKILNLIGS